MLRLKVTKTSLYKLVSDYEKLPLMRRTMFTKAPRQPDYWLEWLDSGGPWCEAYLAAVGGRAILSITKKELFGSEVSRMVYSFSLKELEARGMVEEYVTAVECRRAKGEDVT